VPQGDIVRPLNHLVGNREQLIRNVYGKRFGGLEVDNQLELGCRLLAQNFSWRCQSGVCCAVIPDAIRLVLQLLHITDKFLKQLTRRRPGTLLKLADDLLLAEAAKVSRCANLDPHHIRQLYDSRKDQFRVLSTYTLENVVALLLPIALKTQKKFRRNGADIAQTFAAIPIKRRPRDRRDPAVLVNNKVLNRTGLMRMFTSLLMPTATKEQADAFNELQRLSASPECAVRYLETVADLTVRELLSQVKSPTLVMHVRDDALVPSKLGRELATGISGARFVALPGKNHVPLEQDLGVPLLFEELKDFLKNPI
jgi:pimeloyl-ACP methyl ester carboxylesterase